MKFLLVFIRVQISCALIMVQDHDWAIRCFYNNEPIMEKMGDLIGYFSYSHQIYVEKM